MDETETTDEVEGEALPSTSTVQVEEAVGHASQRPSSTPTSSAHTEDVGETTELIGDEHASPTGEEEESLEEIERNGRKAKIPAWLKAELMLQTDYNRQTAELAESRRALEEERVQIGQAVQAEVSAQANLLLIQRQLERYSKLDWNELYDSNATEGQKAFTQFQLLKDARTQTQTYLDNLRAERRSREMLEVAARREECAAVLARDLKDWSSQTATQLLDFGQRHYGFSAEDLNGADDPRAIKVLYAAYQWEEHQARLRQAQHHAAAQTTTPAATVGAASPKAGLDDRLSTEEWVRRRNGKLRRRA